MVLDESKNKSKLEAKAKKVIFGGIMEGSKAIRFWDRDSRAIKVSRNFTFSENGELKKLEAMEIPGLGAEGEDTTVTVSQTIQNNDITTEPQIQVTPDTTTQTL